jgi:hypothetical protein
MVTHGSLPQRFHNPIPKILLQGHLLSKEMSIQLWEEVSLAVNHQGQVFLFQISDVILIFALAPTSLQCS